MEEKTIIQSENIFASPKVKRWLVILAIVLAAVLLLSFVSIIIISKSISRAEDELWDLHHHYESRGSLYIWDSPENEEKAASLHKAAGTFQSLGNVGFVLSGLLFIIFIPFLILYLIGRKQKITVTDKRVFGNAAFGKRVDLPLDSVSAVATSAFKGLSVATSSGRITFIGIKNRDEIHKVISDLLIERQSKPKAVVQEEKPAAPSNVAEQLKQLKELVDAGILTQEEFDAKKKQLLGL